MFPCLWKQRAHFSVWVKGEVISMIATTKIKMDLANLQRRIRIDAVQDDRYSRNLQISLYNGSLAFTPPADTSVLVRYRKPDGTAGIYDTLPDGSTAWSISGNTVTVALAPQVCTVSGQAELVVSLLWGGAQLSCFTIGLDIHPQPQGTADSKPYSQISGFLPQPTNAKVGQFLKVAAMENGRVTALQTGSITGSTTVAASADVPDYVAEEAARAADVAQNRQGGSSFTILACSDPHYSASHADAAQLASSVRHAAQAMGVISQRIHIDLAAVLGDLVWDGGESADEATAAMTFVNSALAEAWHGIPNLRVCGNHDCAANSADPLEEDRIFARVGIYNRDAVTDPDYRAGGYCYRDFPQHKLRVILLNTSQASDGSFALSDRQIAWFTQALDLSSLGEGWGSIVLSHHPLDWYGSGHAAVQALKNGGNVLCCIHGHVHNYKVDLVAGTTIPRIAVPNICFHRNNEYGSNGAPENSQGIEFGEDRTYEKTADCARDTALCILTLDRDSGILYADHYGAGYSRVIRLDGSALQSHRIVCDLTGVSISTLPDSLSQGAAFAAELTVEDGYTLQSIAVTMDGVDVTGDVCDGNHIRIDAVTGELVITAVAAKQAQDGEEDITPDAPEEASENLVPSSVDTDGNVFNGTGYLTGYRLNSSGNTTALDGAIASGFIPYTGQVICIGGSAASVAGTVGNYLCLYDSSFQWINSLDFGNLVTYGGQWKQSGSYQLTVDPAGLTNETVLAQLASAAYIRCSLGNPVSADAFTVTLGSSGASSGYTNQVTRSVDTDGTVYNGCGYLTGHRLDASGAVALSGAIASGYVPYNGQVIRIWGSSDASVGVDGNYFCMYGSDFSHINTIDFYNMSNYGAVWEQVGEKYMLTIDPAALTNVYVQEQLASAGYIRASFGIIGSAEDFVITLDESIE